MSDHGVVCSGILRRTIACQTLIGIRQQGADGIIKNCLSEGLRRFAIILCSYTTPGRIDTDGFGKTRLLDPSKPHDGINRRVQVINIEDGQ